MPGKGASIVPRACASLLNLMHTRRNFLGLAGIACAGMRLGLKSMSAADIKGNIAARTAEADRLIAGEVQRGNVAAAGLLVRQADFEFARAYGSAKIETPFLIASPTKPMTVSAVMWLRDRGQLALADPVQKYLPDFAGGERGTVTIKHLLTHTSGLPDMLPENVDLRKRHAPLREFVAGACRTPLLFRPGEK